MNATLQKSQSDIPIGKRTLITDMNISAASVQKRTKPLEKLKMKNLFVSYSYSKGFGASIIPNFTDNASIDTMEDLAAIRSGIFHALFTENENESDIVIINFKWLPY